MKKGLIILGIIVSLVFIVNIVRIKITENRINDNYTEIIELHKGEKYRIENFPLLTQQYYYSCSIATICSLNIHYGKNITEDEFMEKNGIKINWIGVFAGKFYEYLKMSLPDYTIEMKENAKNSEIIELIIKQLKNNIPVPIFYSTIDITNMTRFGTHYSNIIGIDIDNDEIEIANVYGYLEKITIENFLEKLKHKDKIMKNDWIIELAKSIGLIKGNTIYLLEAK